MMYTKWQFVSRQDCLLNILDNLDKFIKKLQRKVALRIRRILNEIVVASLVVIVRTWFFLKSKMAVDVFLQK